MAQEIVVDSFAGGGGASTGIEAALGQAVHAAINHDEAAIAMHAVNHPDTLHFNSNIYQLDPRDVRPGEPIGLFWASPDCTHHSKAKGGVPVRNEGRNSRDLAWVIIQWAELRKPRIIMMENVEEWQSWGPLILKDGTWRACPDRRGDYFRQWCQRLRRCGYTLEMRQLVGCDYGAPTIRKRLFVIARRDGEPIVWPEPSHGAPDDEAVLSGTKKPWPMAAQILDWSQPCPSLFMDAEEADAFTQRTGLRVKRPLAPNTLRRVAKGVKRYVLDAMSPFIVTLNHGGEHQRGWGLDEPFRTITAARDAHALIVPALTYAQHGGAVRDPRDPLHTVTASSKDQNALITPVLVPRYGERPGQMSRARGVKDPLATVVGTGNGASLVAPFLAQHNTGVVGHDAREPVSTITTRGTQQGVVAAHLTKYFGKEGGPRLDKPMCTMTTRDRAAVVATHMVPQYGASVARACADPVATVTAGGGGKQSVVATHLCHHYSSSPTGGEGDAKKPLKTLTAGGQHASVVSSSLEAPPFTKAHEARARQVADLLREHDCWDDREFVTVTVHGQIHVIVDIGLRMLTPREQFRAQGFPDSYIIDRDAEGNPFTKTTQVRCCGNSVCPPIAEALVRANYQPRRVETKAERVEGPLFDGRVAAE